MTTIAKQAGKKGKSVPVPELRRPARRSPRGALKVKMVLVPVDFSEYSRRALAYAVSLARSLKAELILLHVVESFPIDRLISPEALKEDTSARLRGAESELQALTEAVAADGAIKRRQIVRLGKPYVQIIEAAREIETDMIILGSHGYTGLQRVYLGSTAERVVRHAPCHVLVVRE